MVDDLGMPRVRCACGNPLLALEVETDQSFEGSRWSGFDDDQTVVVEPAAEPVTELIVLDVAEPGVEVVRPLGTDGRDDFTATKPANDPKVAGVTEEPSTGSPPVDEPPLIVQLPWGWEAPLATLPPVVVAPPPVVVAPRPIVADPPSVSVPPVVIDNPPVVVPQVTIGVLPSIVVPQIVLSPLGAD